MKLSQLENIVTASEALHRALADSPALTALQVSECLKAASDRAVFRATLNGEPVVAKLSLGASASEEVTAQAAELQFHAARMSDGPYRVPRLVAADPARGLLIMECVPGLRLIDAMKDRNGGDRLALAAMAGRWLAHLTAERRQIAPLATGYWRRRIADFAEEAGPAEDRKMLRALGSWMDTCLPLLEGARITQVRGHGDFCPLNLIVDGEVLYGVDLQSRRWFALLRDLARFLVVSRIGHGDPTVSCFGVDRDEMQALVAAPGLIDPAEADMLLPFFLACEMGGRLVSEAHKPNSRRKLHQMIGDFLCFDA